MPITLFVNNTQGTNTNVNPLGNQITINLNPVIHLDYKKEYIMRVLSSQILYCFSNVSTVINDKLYYNYNSHAYTLIFPQGIYSLAAINDEISRQTNDQTNNPYLLGIQGDVANSSVYLVFNDPTVTIDCNHADSILQILGFPTSTGLVGPYSEQGTQFSTGLPASLNNTSSIIIV